MKITTFYFVYAEKHEGEMFLFYGKKKLDWTAIEVYKQLLN